MIADSHPILSCDEAKRLEAKLLGGDEAKEWAAMQRAGRAVAAAALADFEEIGGWPAAGRLLVLAGKGHNGGDALLAAQEVLGRFPAAHADVLFVFGERDLRPLAAKAYRALAQTAGNRLRVVQAESLAANYDLCLDGIFGFQFHPPAGPLVSALLKRVNSLPIRLRAAVDLPSGLSDADRIDPTSVFHADFTYATGIVKLPVIGPEHATVVGRLRYLDLGFFTNSSIKAHPNILTPAIIAPLAALRSPESDKRTFGHLFIMGGSRGYPGAVLMAAMAALRSGAGLVTAFVPESIAAAYAARVPEVMWVGWPETPEGGLALEGMHLMRARLERATALLIGPGLGREAETLALAQNMVEMSPVPLVLDADALQPDIVRAGTTPRVLTPHTGEFMRILDGKDYRELKAASPSAIVLKGRLTSISDDKSVYYSSFGGPVLARGGSGDLLAGLIGGLLAQTPVDPLQAACRGVVWHGRAADLLARAHGQTAVQTTQLLDFLPAALRS